MVTGELRNKVDQIWQTIWTGGITSPITVPAWIFDYSDAPARATKDLTKAFVT